jgi:N-methylhydantoinase A/oxoprolinase/acetone carboxylase beta subunit
VLAIDAGGTMTDTLIVDERRRVRVGKAQTTPQDESVGFMESSRDAFSQWSSEPGEAFPAIVSGVNSGTAMLNRLLSRTGRRVGAIVTAGQEDHLRIERGIQTYIPAVVPRSRVKGVRRDRLSAPRARGRRPPRRPDRGVRGRLRPGLRPVRAPAGARLPGHPGHRHRVGRGREAGSPRVRAPEPNSAHPVWFDDRFVEADIYELEAVGAGQEVEGPAVLESPATTLVVPPRTRAALDRHQIFHLEAER